MPEELISFESVQTLYGPLSLEELAAMLEVTVDYVMMEFLPSGERL
jgi:hypothetical protein